MHSGRVITKNKNSAGLDLQHLMSLCNAVQARTEQAAGRRKTCMPVRRLVPASNELMFKSEDPSSGGRVPAQHRQGSKAEAKQAMTLQGQLQPYVHGEDRAGRRLAAAKLQGHVQLPNRTSGANRKSRTPDHVAAHVKEAQRYFGPGTWNGACECLFC